MTFPLARLFGPILAAAIVPPYNPVTDIPDLLFFNSYRTVTPTGAIFADSVSHGPFPGRRLTFTAPSNLACNIGGAGLDTAYAGGSAVFAGYTNAANNGSWNLINAGLSSITATNPAGVSEPTVAGAPTVATATVSIQGMCTTYNDLLAGYPFTQGTIINKWAVNNRIVPGKRVLGCEASYNRGITCASAPLASALNGTQACTFFTYYRPTIVSVSGAGTTPIGFHNAGSSNRIQFGWGNATTGNVNTANSGGQTTQVVILSPGITLNVWQLIAATLTGNTATFYINGVQVGTTTSGTTRSRSGMDQVTIGYHGTGQGTGGHRAVDGAVARVMTPAELLDLTAWCQAEYA